MLNDRFSKNPHYLWSDSIGKVICFNKKKIEKEVLHILLSVNIRIRIPRDY